MDSRARQSVGPLYLLFCLLLGGSAQGIWANMTLQLVGVAILAWSAAAWSDRTATSSARQLMLLAMLAIAVLPASAGATTTSRAGWSA